MAQLKSCCRDRATYAAVVTALEEGGRDLDVDGLAAMHDLDVQARRLVRRLARFGDVGRRPFYAFASVCLAVISPPRQHVGSPTTYIMVTRRGGQLDFWWIDSADSGFGALGVRGEPLTGREAEAMVRQVIAAQASYDVVDHADRSPYAPGRASTLRIRSAFYPRLDAGVRRRTSRRTRHRR